MTRNPYNAMMLENQDTVTITISRKDAEFLAAPGSKVVRWNHPIVAVIRAALKETE